ncbi:MAG TPA: hypothetical protein VF816_11450 [Rhodocyclaceae bacterium]
MTALINGYPTEEELRNRIVRQLSWRGTDTVALIWHGYLSGLLEWGLIELSVHDRLLKLLPEVGNKELYELFTDEPLTAEQEAEIEEHLRNQSKKD